MASPERIAHSYRAVERARRVLKAGDRIGATECCDHKFTVTMTGWDGPWICSATRDDISAFNIYKVNGVPTSFRDEGSV